MHRLELRKQSTNKSIHSLDGGQFYRQIGANFRGLLDDRLCMWAHPQEKPPVFQEPNSLLLISGMEVRFMVQDSSLIYYTIYIGQVLRQLKKFKGFSCIFNTPIIFLSQNITKNITEIRIMKLPHIIVFCILVVRGSSCESICQNLVMNSCNICYNSCTEAFVSCYRTTCDVFAEEQQGVGPCDQYEMQELSEAKCFQKCCYDVTDKTFSKDQLDVCSQDDQRALGILIGVTVGSILLLAGIGVLLMWKIGGINPCQICCDCVSENQAIIPAEVAKNTMKQKETDLEWKRQSKQKLLTSKCRRCKKQKPRVIGKCGCFLHFSCANDFAIRSSLCGQCFNNINPIKYFCDKCYNGYVSITIPKNYNSATTEKIVARLQCPFCNEVQAEDLK